MKIENKTIVSLTASKGRQNAVVVTLNDGGMAQAAEADSGLVGWSRFSAGGGAVLGTADIQYLSRPALQIAVKKNEKGFCLMGRELSNGVQGDVFLDEWRQFLNVNLKNEYTEEAVIYDKNENKIYKLTDEADPDPARYIGYLFMSKVRSLPNGDWANMKPGRVARIALRLVDSHLPKLAGFPSGAENQVVGKDRLRDGREGVVNVPVPGNVELGAAFEIYTKHPDSLSVLAWATEEDV